MGHLMSVSSHTIWGPLSDHFHCLLYGAPLRSVSLHAIGGPPQVLVFSQNIWGPPQISFSAYYMEPPQVSFFAYYMGRGVPRIWQGGVKNFFFRFGNLHVTKRHGAHGEAMRFVRGFGGMLPRENFLKWCNLVRFGVYFDQILSLKNIQKLPFFI